MTQNKYRKQFEKKYDQKSEYETKYVFRERGITIYPPYKKLRPRNFVRGRLNTKGDEGTNEGIIKSKQGRR